jgi:hypothetical protein
VASNPNIRKVLGGILRYVGGAWYLFSGAKMYGPFATQEDGINFANTLLNIPSSNTANT